MNQLLSKLIDRFGIYKKNKLKSLDSQFVKNGQSVTETVSLDVLKHDSAAPDFEFEKSSEQGAHEVGTFRFKSRVQSNGENNCICTGQYYRNTAENETDVVIVHGWKSSSLRSAKEMLLVPLMTKGYNLYFMELPHHLSRKQPESGFSGEYMISANVQRTIMSVQQAVMDAGDLVSSSKANAHKTVVIGLSLGGLVTNMLGCTGAPIDALVSVMYASNLAHLVWNSAVAKHIKADFMSNGFTYEALEKAWSVLNPALRKPLVDKDKILLISGRDDLFITKEDSEALCSSWGNPKRIVIPCGHSGLNVCKEEIANDICRFIDAAL